MTVHTPTLAEIAHVMANSDKAEIIDWARGRGVAVLEGRGRVEKFWAGDDPARATPYEVIDSDPNLFLTAGVTNLWNLAAGIAADAWGSAAYLGVGDSTTAAAAGQTDLQAATNKVRFAVSGVPSVSTNQCVWSGTAGTAVANFAWEEAGVFTLSAAGVMLNRLVTSFGTKTSAASWTYSHTCSIA